MEIRIIILDTFPSLNKLYQKINLILEINTQEYELNRLINQKEIISIQQNTNILYVKLYALFNSQKVLIGANQINFDLLNLENEHSIFWLEFKKEIEQNKSGENDINLLFYDFIRLKVKIISINIIPKSYIKVKTNKNRIKNGLESPCQQENMPLDNMINSWRLENPNNYSNYTLNSNLLKERIKINKENINENIMNCNKNKTRNISYECMKDLSIENKVLLTDGIKYDNYSCSTTQGNCNKNNVIDESNLRKSDMNRYQKSILTPNKFKIMIKNTTIQTKEENKKNTKKCNYFNKYMFDKENYSFNNFNSKIKKNRKLQTKHKKNKSFNKITYFNPNNIEKINFISKIKYKNINKSLSKDNILYYTFNNFYKSKKEKKLSTKKDISVRETKHQIKLNPDTTQRKSLNEALSKDVITNIQVSQFKVHDYCDDNNDKNNENNFDEFSEKKKDYELFYTLKFIRSIKNDLIDLEFNIALDKSIYLFKLYNKETNIFDKTKNNLINTIVNYSNKIKQMHKKIYLLKIRNKKNELKEKNIMIIKECKTNKYKEVIAQKKILENLIDQNNKKQKIKEIVSTLVKKHKLSFDNNYQRENNENGISKYITQTKFYDIKNGNSKNIQMNLSENKIKKISKKKSLNLIYEKKNLIALRNLKITNSMKNNFINAILSFEEMNNRYNIYSEKINRKQSKIGEIKNSNFFLKDSENSKNNNSIFYSTAKTKFYSSNKL